MVITEGFLQVKETDMNRSKIQKIILPRNWIFGRIAYITGNLSTMIRNDRLHFTLRERNDLKTAHNLILKVLREKKESSEFLKRMNT
jgi:hypothetical protein